MPQDLESRIKALEAEIGRLKYQADRLKAIEDIQYLMGQYMSLHVPCVANEQWKLYANRPDSSHESFEGRITGIENVKKLYELFTPKDAAGAIYEHHLCTPTIMVADDLQTARGLWWSPGFETGGKRPDGKYIPLWCWAKYNVDFIIEDGRWKLWHTHFYLTFMTDYHVSWVDIPPELADGFEINLGDIPFSPTKKSCVYHPDRVSPPVPFAPEPYKTWTPDREWA
jgi:hypothetical protein